MKKAYTDKRCEEEHHDFEESDWAAGFGKCKTCGFWDDIPQTGGQQDDT